MRFFLILIIPLLLSSTSKAQLRCSQNGYFRNLKDALKVHPDSVYGLDLGNNGLKKFPKEILKFKNLESIEFSDYDGGTIQGLCPGLLSKRQTKRLERIKKRHGIHYGRYATPIFNKTRIKYIPKEIKSLQNLKTLSISGLKLKKKNAKLLLEWLPNCPFIYTRYKEYSRGVYYYEKVNP